MKNIKTQENSGIFDDKDFVSFIYDYHKVKKKFDKTPKEIISSIFEKILLPISIFVPQLGCLETVVKYLKENLELNFKEISLHLNRTESNIRISYSNSKKKLPQRFETVDFLQQNTGQIFIPIEIFTNTKLSMLESVVNFLKEELGLKYNEISALIKRDQRTVWTVYRRALKKTSSDCSISKSKNYPLKDKT